MSESETREEYKMSLVNVLNVIVKQAKTPFQKEITFEIFFESIKSLKHALTWRIIYIGQASTDEFDQILEEAEMDCTQAARMKFELSVSNQNYFSIIDFI